MHLPPRGVRLAATPCGSSILGWAAKALALATTCCADDYLFRTERPSSRRTVPSYGRKSRLDLGAGSSFWGNLAQPPWEVRYFEHLCHPLWRLLRYFLLFSERFADLKNVDLGKTFGESCFAI